MTSSWSEHKLGDLIQINPDALNKTYPYSEIEYLDISSVGTGFYTEVRRLKLEEAPSRAKRLVSDGDTIISTVRPGNKSYCYLKKTTPRMVVSTGFAVLRAKKDLLDERFLYYLVSNPAFTEYLVAHEKGAAYPAVGTDTIEHAIVKVPDLSTQKKISEILGSLDDKIELNRRMNETLEQMAMALYKHWFVDFGPFQEKTEDGIPIGWTSGYLGEISDIVMGQSPKSSYYNNVGEGLPFHQGVTNFGDRIPKHEVYSSQILKVAKRGDILVSVRAPVGRINIADRDIVIGRGLSAFRHKSNKMSYLFYTLKNIFKEEDSIGSGTVFNSVSKSDLEKIPILIPPNEIIEQFENQVKEIDRLILTNIFEIRSLIETRDYLLPRLLSGEIEVKTAEEQVEEVLAHA